MSFERVKENGVLNIERFQLVVEELGKPDVALCNQISAHVLSVFNMLRSLFPELVVVLGRRVVVLGILNAHVEGV